MGDTLILTSLRRLGIRLWDETAGLIRTGIPAEAGHVFHAQSSFPMPLPYPTLIPGLRSPHDQVNGLVYFGRMLDKIRLQAEGKLPEGWQPMRGDAAKGSFDWRCCRFLKVSYADVEAETLKRDKTDEELLAWAYASGREPTEDEVEVWNGFMTKRGWRDAGTQRLNERLAEIGLSPGTAQTMFEFIDIDEGRGKPASVSA